MPGRAPAGTPRGAIGQPRAPLLVLLLLLFGTAPPHCDAQSSATALFPEGTVGGVGPWNLFPPYAAGHPVSEAQPNWEIGTEEAPVVFTEWKGVFHDGSGPLGTYDPKMDSHFLIDPCGGQDGCRILMWFDLFETEYLTDRFTVYDGRAIGGTILAELSGDSPPLKGVDPETTLIYSLSGTVLVHFHSDATKQKQGFTCRYKSDQDATLKTLIAGFPPSADFLKPAFGLPMNVDHETSYMGAVEHELTNTTIRAEINDEHPYDPWVVSHPQGDSGYIVQAPVMRFESAIFPSNSTFEKDLETGSSAELQHNIFTIQVTACNGITRTSYLVDVFRPADVEAHLRALSFSTGETEPRFSQSEFSYNTSVIYEIETAQVEAMPVDPQVQSVWIGRRGTEGEYVVHGSAIAVSLLHGVRNAVDVVVTAEDGINVLTYTNYITRPMFSKSQYERQYLTGEWRRNQHGDNMLMTLGGHWNPCEDAWATERGEIKEECRENSWELTTVEYDDSVHTMRGWYEVNPYQSPVLLSLDVLEATGMYTQLENRRLQGFFRLTDWPTPSTDGLSIDSRTHINVEMDMAVCVSLEGTGAVVDNSIDAEGVVGAELLVKPESVGPFGQIPWSCPKYAPVLGNDTSRFYTQLRRDVDECKDHTDQCSVDAICTNTYGSRWCACRTGFEGNAYFDTCLDIDECAIGTHLCGEHTHCINTPGAYNCTCNHGYEGNPAVYTFDVDVTPDGSIDVVKQPGLEWECVSVHQNHTCQHIPTVYPHRDESVRAGRRGAVGDPQRPNDPDGLWHFDDPPNPEYSATSQHYYREKTDPAYVEALTESVPYPPPRWHSDGVPAADNECSDIDECSTESHGCSDNGYCFNVPGSFSCHCHTGYEGDPYTPSGCRDIDECETGTDHCSEMSVCRNVPGTHTCECPNSIYHSGQLFWDGRVPGKPYNSRCHMPLRQSRAFVTYERWTGEQINTLNGADAKCHSEGPELQPGFRWKAILSDGGTDAIHHVTAGETAILFPVLRTDGELVAVDEAQLWEGMALRQSTVRGDKGYFGLSNPINVDGSGLRIEDEPEWAGAHEVWTGSTQTGTKYESGDCWNWQEQATFAQNQVGGEGPTDDLAGVGHQTGTVYSGHHAGTVDARSPMYAGDVWNYDGPVDSDISYGRPRSSVPAGAGGSYGDLRSTFRQWHTGRDTLRECETKRRRLFCIEAHYATESVLRDPMVSTFGDRANASWFTASASTVVRANDVFPTLALDGSNQTFWMAHFADTDVWFQVDMHAHFTVTAVLLNWHDGCFPAAYSLMLSNSRDAYPAPPTSKFSNWHDPSLQDDQTEDDNDRSWRIFHEIISRTWRGGDNRLDNPSLLAREMTDRMLVKDPQASVTAVSPPEVSRHVRMMVTDDNDQLCHAIAEFEIYAAEERPFGSYSEGSRRANFRGLQGDGVEHSSNGVFPRSRHGSVVSTSVDGNQAFNERDAFPTPSDGTHAYTSGTDRHLHEAPAAYPQVTSHAPPGWEFIQLRARSRSTELQRETRYDNMRHRYTQADSKLNVLNADHPQYPCPPGVMSCDSREPSSQEGHKRQDMPTANMPTPVNYNGEVVGCTHAEGCTDDTLLPIDPDAGWGAENRYNTRVIKGGPSVAYRPRGSQDGDVPPYFLEGSSEEKYTLDEPVDANESPLRQHNPDRGTVQEYDMRADTSSSYRTQPTHPTQRKASAPHLDGPQWKPTGPHDDGRGGVRYEGDPGRTGEDEDEDEDDNP
jgi:hypothetical protein